MKLCSGNEDDCTYGSGALQLGTWSADSPFLQQQQQQQQQQGDDAHRSSSDGRPLENGEVGTAQEVVNSCMDRLTAWSTPDQSTMRTCRVALWHPCRR